MNWTKEIVTENLKISTGLTDITLPYLNVARRIADPSAVFDSDLYADMFTLLDIKQVKQYYLESIDWMIKNQTSHMYDWPGFATYSEFINWNKTIEWKDFANYGKPGIKFWGSVACYQATAAVCKRGFPIGGCIHCVVYCPLNIVFINTELKVFYPTLDETSLFCGTPQSFGGITIAARRQQLTCEKNSTAVPAEKVQDYVLFLERLYAVCSDDKAYREYPDDSHLEKAAYILLDLTRPKPVNTSEFSEDK